MTRRDTSTKFAAHIRDTIAADGIAPTVAIKALVIVAASLATKPPVSHQRRTQLRAKANGMCHIHTSTPVIPGKATCERCRQAKGYKKAHPTAAQWQAVDWSQSDKEIATALGVGTRIVGLRRATLSLK